jgi:hypothetical protein
MLVSFCSCCGLFFDAVSMPKDSVEISMSDTWQNERIMKETAVHKARWYPGICRDRLWKNHVNPDDASVMRLHYVVGYIAPGVSKDYRAFIFRVKQSCSSPWRREILSDKAYDHRNQLSAAPPWESAMSHAHPVSTAGPSRYQPQSSQIQAQKSAAATPTCSVNATVLVAVLMQKMWTIS